MYPEKSINRSFRRFRRRLASSRRRFIRALRRMTGEAEMELLRLPARIPTRQERRTAEAFRLDMQDLETV